MFFLVVNKNSFIVYLFAFLMDTAATVVEVAPAVQRRNTFEPAASEKFLREWFPQAADVYALGCHPVVTYVDLRPDAHERLNAALPELLEAHTNQLVFGSLRPYTNQCFEVELQVSEWSKLALKGQKVRAWMQVSLPQVLPTSQQLAHRPDAVVLSTNTERRDAFLETLQNPPADPSDRFRLYQWEKYSGYREVDVGLRLRKPENVFGYDAVYKEIIEMQQVLRERKQKMLENGTAGSLNFVWYGQPGMGKTSSLVALAVQMKAPLFLLNVATALSTDDLLKALNPCDNAIVAIEDFDRYLDIIEKAEGRGAMMSDLQNALDGVANATCVIRIFTANHVEGIKRYKVLRDRITHFYHFSFSDPAYYARMVKQFYPGADDAIAQRLADHCVTEGYTMRELRSQLVRMVRHGDDQTAAEKAWEQRADMVQEVVETEAMKKDVQMTSQHAADESFASIIAGAFLRASLAKHDGEETLKANGKRPAEEEAAPKKKKKGKKSQ